MYSIYVLPSLLVTSLFAGRGKPAWLRPRRAKRLGGGWRSWRPVRSSCRTACACSQPRWILFSPSFDSFTHVPNISFTYKLNIISWLEYICKNCEWPKAACSKGLICIKDSGKLEPLKELLLFFYEEMHNFLKISIYQPELPRIPSDVFFLLNKRKIMPYIVFDIFVSTVRTNPSKKKSWDIFYSFFSKNSYVPVNMHSSQ